MTISAAILAGGLGTRLRSVVNDRPKVLAQVAGRPFITHLLDQLVLAGVESTVLCTGYLAQMVRETLGESYRGMALHYSVETSPLGTAGALRHAAGHFSGDTLLVLNGDSYCRCDLGEFRARQSASGARAAMVLTEVEDVARFGAVRTDAGSLVQSFREKGEQTGPGLINAGIYLLPRTLIEQIEPGRESSLERELFPAIIPQGLYGHRCGGPFIDIGIPAEYQRSQQLFSELKEARA